MTTSESYLDAHAHASRQYFVACKGLIHLYVTMTIRNAHAQKYFSPETKSRKCVQKKNSPVYRYPRNNDVCAENDRDVVSIYTSIVTAQMYG